MIHCSVAEAQRCWEREVRGMGAYLRAAPGASGDVGPGRSGVVGVGGGCRSGWRGRGDG
jgi:hypothetical protein